MAIKITISNGEVDCYGDKVEDNFSFSFFGKDLKEANNNLGRFFDLEVEEGECGAFQGDAIAYAMEDGYYKLEIEFVSDDAEREAIREEIRDSNYAAIRKLKGWN
jgi:hypothetical protein